jgi:hypothetical protein
LAVVVAVAHAVAGPAAGVVHLGSKAGRVKDAVENVFEKMTSVKE